MDEQTKMQAKRAAKQATHAAKNGTEAAEAAGEELASEVTDRIDARAIGFGLGNVGQGFIALGIATYASAVAYSKFRQASITK